MKIAIIEDELSIAAMYEHKLKTYNFDVKLAHDGKQGLELLESFQPDLALIDLKMPHLKGDQMLERVRTHDWGANMRVIILTNISKDEAPASLRFLGIDRYIVKAHHTPSQVLQIVKEVLNIKPDKQLSTRA